MKERDMIDNWLDEYRHLRLPPLTAGAHDSPEEGLCIMEMVAYLQREPHSDHPRCACPVLTEFAILLNDRIPNQRRQELVPMAARLAGSRSTADVAQMRAELLAMRAVNVFAPLALRAADLEEHARACEQASDLIAARDAAAAARAAAHAAASAAADAAADAAHAAASAASAAADAAADAAYAAYAAAYAADAASADAAYAAYAASAAAVAEETWTLAIRALSDALDIGSIPSVRFERGRVEELAELAARAERGERGEMGT